MTLWVDVVNVYLPYLLSIVSIIAMWQQGNMKRWSWLLTLVNQLGWLVWIVCSKNWGFLPLNLVLWGVAARNYVKWGKL